MKTIKRTFEVKEGRKWRVTYETEDVAEVYKSYAGELTRAKIWKAPYYTKVVSWSNSDGTYTWVFYQENGRSVYIIAL